MKKNLTKMMLIALLAIFPLSIFAQSAYQKKYFYMGVEGGLSVYHGDLSNYKVWWKNIKDFNTRHLAFDGKLTLGYQFGGVVGMNLKLGYVGLTGEKADVASYLADPRTKWITVGAPKDADYGEAGPEELGYNTYEFSKTHALDASINATFDLCNLIGGYRWDRVFHFAPHVGVGALMFTPQSVYGYNLPEDQVKLTADNPYQSGDEVIEAAGEGMFGKPQVTVTLPVGAEMYWSLRKKGGNRSIADIFIDYTYNFTFTDKIDRMTKGADEKFLYNDKWGTVNLGVRFKFVKKLADIERMAREAGQVTYTVIPDPLEEHDGKVECDVEVKIPAKYFDKNATMTLTPYVNYNGKQIELEPITFVGEKVNNIPGTEVSYKHGGTFTFHNIFDYDFSDDEGMKNSTINGRPIFNDNLNEGHTLQGAEQVIYKDGIVRTTPYEYNLSVCDGIENGTVTLSEQGEVAAGTAITVTATPIKGAELQSLYYTVNGQRTEIDKNSKQFTMPNGETVVCATFELKQLPVQTFYFKVKSSEFRTNRENNNAIKALIENKEYAKGFDLQGYASVEGEVTLNQNLSVDRANAVKKAFDKKLLDDSMEITSNGNGEEDWNKMRDEVLKSDLKDKDAIVNVINEYAKKSKAEKEKKIRELMEIYYPDFENIILKAQRRVDVFPKR